MNKPGNVASRVLNVGIRRNVALTRALFGVRLQQGERIQWDFTTLVLRKALLRIVKPGMRILEIGTGPYALLPLCLESRYDCSIDACDVNPDYVALAGAAIERAASGVRVFQSDVFDRVENLYDIVFSNTLYIPRAKGIERGIDALHKSETDWCGGETGYEFIERLLAGAAERLLPGGNLLLGFNGFYLSEKKLREYCIQHSYQIVTKTKMIANPSVVLHLQPILGLHTPAPV